MTQDEIIEMAEQAGFEIDCCSLEWHKRITAFAKLVAAKEREECALICDDQASGAYWEGADACADRIRARGQA
jgi:hypothetical protein